MGLKDFVYVEPSSDGNIKSRDYVKELLLHLLLAKSDVIVNDSAGVLKDNVVALLDELYPTADVYEFVAINAQQYVGFPEAVLEHDILEAVTPRLRVDFSNKLVVITHGGREFCDKVLKICNSDLQHKESA